MLNVSIKPHRLFTVACFGLIALWLSGCVSAQPAPSSPESVISSIAPNDVRKVGETGSTVRWGGTIASISNTGAGNSVVEIVSRPLQSNGRPLHNDQSAGRFIAETSEFLDPNIIVVGRDMTLVGTVREVREGKVGKADYLFPVVAIDTYRYWSKQSTESAYQGRHGYGYRHYGHDRYWGHSRRHHPRRYRSGVTGSFGIILR